jgi:peptidoglycan hydrolase-like protein with peptidoglycan-binding domain
MNPMAIAAAAGLAGLAGYFGYKKLKTPDKNDFQTMDILGPGGVYVKVATPVSNAVTTAQATATVQGPTTTGQYTAVPTTVPGQGVVYAPPGTVTVASGGGVMQPAPIIVTPAGAASIAVGSVKDVQHCLNALGYASPLLVEDGKIGPKTVAAIKNFQTKTKLSIDGVAGPATKAALSAALSNIAGGASAIGAIIQNSTPQTGSITTPTGTKINTAPALTMAISAVQHILNILGAKPALVEDGKLGPKSVAAIKSFQTAHGLVPDGVAGPKTKTALYLASLPSTPQAAATPATTFYQYP